MRTASTHKTDCPSPCTVGHAKIIPNAVLIDIKNSVNKMKADILKINCGLFYVFPEVDLLGTGKHCPIGSAREILNAPSKYGCWIPKAKDKIEEWQRYKICS